jgi:hypothetical protein
VGRYNEIVVASAPSKAKSPTVVPAGPADEEKHQHRHTAYAAEASGLIIIAILLLILVLIRYWPYIPWGAR